MIENNLGKWLSLLLSFTTAVHGAAALGPLAQSALMAAAMIGRLTSRAIGCGIR